MSRCGRCPVADPAVRCRGLDVPRYCELIDPVCEQYDPAYVGVIERESHGVYRPEPIPPTEVVELIRVVRACPFRSVTTGCDCGRCGLRHGAAVSHVDCFACLKEFT